MFILWYSDAFRSTNHLLNWIKLDLELDLTASAVAA